MKVSAKILEFAMAALMVFPFAGCGGESGILPPSSSSAEKTKVKAAALSGFYGIGMARLMEQSDSGTAANDYSFTISDSADDIASGLVSGKYDIAAIPTHTAAEIYNSTQGGIKILALNTRGALSIVDGSGSVESIADLRGKTVYIAANDAMPEYVLDYILSENGIDPESGIEKKYISGQDELDAYISGDTAQTVLLAEADIAAMIGSREGFKTVISLSEEWEKITGQNDDGSILAMGCVIVRSEFSEENGAAVDAFLEEYRESIDYVSENLSEAVRLCEEYGIITGSGTASAVSEEAVSDCNAFFVSGEEMRDYADSFLKVLYSYEPALVGGKLPDDCIYYIE